MNFYTNNNDNNCYCETCRLVKGFLLMIALGLSGRCNCKFSALKEKFTPKAKTVPSLQMLTSCYLLNRGQGVNINKIRSDFPLPGSFLCHICYTHRPLEYKINYGKEIINNTVPREICEFCYPRKYNELIIPMLSKKLKCNDLRIIVPAILKYPQDLDKLIETCKKEIKLYERNNV